jgi:hypothetical protein
MEEFRTLENTKAFLETGKSGKHFYGTLRVKDYLKLAKKGDPDQQAPSEILQKSPSQRYNHLLHRS